MFNELGGNELMDVTGGARLTSGGRDYGGLATHRRMTSAQRAAQDRVVASVAFTTLGAASGSLIGVCGRCGCYCNYV
jgi:hypothetical protein